MGQREPLLDSAGAAERGVEGDTKLVVTVRRQGGDALAEPALAQCVEVVEGGDAILPHTIVWTEWQLAGETTYGAGACSHDDRLETVCDGVAGEDEHRPVAARRGRPPDFASHHDGVADHASGSSANASSSFVSGLAA